MLAFAQSLKRARKSAGYSSAEKFALALNMEGAAYRKYERGDSSPNIETLTRICLLLQIEPNQLMPYAVSRHGDADGKDQAA